MSIQDWDVTDLTDFFIYLDDLRESGATNMFGAGHLLIEEFGLERSDAQTVLGAWMSTFSGDPAEERAAVAQAA